MQTAQLRRRLKTSLTDALKARDTVAVAALRSAVSAIDNAEAVEGPHRTRPHLGVGVGEVARRDLSAQELIGILRTEVDERMSAAAEYERLGRADQAKRLRMEAAVLQSHLAEA